jgi:hypothetical protein
MDKLELRKEYRAIYSAKTTESLVEVPALKALAIEGEGDPDASPRFAEATAALYSVAYSLKFSLKKSAGRDWAVMPLEGDWYADDISRFSMDRKEEWKWTLYIVQPDFVTAKDLGVAMEAAARKDANPALADLLMALLPAHRAAQVLHVGPYEAEPPTIARLHEFIRSQGLALTGRHREIYLGDPRRTAPERLKTIIRQPVR